MGVLFNVLNALMQGGWIFYISPADRYPSSWLLSPQFIIGTVIFILPKEGMFRYVTSANYFGEFIEWTGFAILTWSWAGAVFALWTFANLAPRAAKIYNRYSREFKNEFSASHLKRIIPYIY